MSKYHTGTTKLRVIGHSGGIVPSIDVDTGNTLGDLRAKLTLLSTQASFAQNGQLIESVSEPFLMITKSCPYELVLTDADSLKILESRSGKMNLRTSAKSTREICLAMGDNVFATFTTADNGYQFQSDIEQLVQEGVIKEKHVPREILRNSVRRLDKLGGGAFGDVFKGYLEEPNSAVPAYLVAIKTLKGSPTPWERKEFIREAAIMAQIRHKNIVSLVGVVTKGEPYMLLLQFCEHGSLDSFLKNHTGMLDLSLVARLQISRDVCEGCCYLAELGLIHRDIAARNVLVASDWTCKLADFGMSRSMEEDSYYVQGDRGKIPIRWSSPEVLEDGKFSEKSDVWAYGIVVYEVLTRGQTPYKGLTNQQVWKKVCGGYRLERPPLTPDELYEIMMYCWQEYAERPLFRDVLPRIQRVFDDERLRVGNIDSDSPLSSGPNSTFDSMSSATSTGSLLRGGSAASVKSIKSISSDSRSINLLSSMTRRDSNNSNELAREVLQVSLEPLVPQHEYVYNDVDFKKDADEDASGYSDRQAIKNSGLVAGDVYGDRRASTPTSSAHDGDDKSRRNTPIQARDAHAHARVDDRSRRPTSTEDKSRRSTLVDDKSRRSTISSSRRDTLQEDSNGSSDAKVEGTTLRIKEFEI